MAGEIYMCPECEKILPPFLYPSICWQCASRKQQNPPNYDSVFRIIRERGITTVQDLTEVSSNTDIRRYLFRRNEDPWVKDLFIEMGRIFSLVLRTCENSKPPRFISEMSWGWNEKKPTDQIFDIHAKYNCVFSRQPLFVSSDFTYWEEDNEITISLTFLVLLLTLRPALEAGMAYLVPSRINHRETFRSENNDSPLDGTQWSNTLITKYDYQRAKNVVTIKTGQGHGTLKRSLPASPSETRNIQIVVTPWLWGARFEDYLEIAVSSLEAFDAYSEGLWRLHQNSSASIESMFECIKDLSNQRQAILTVFRQKQRELETKGINTTLGVVFTVGRFLAGRAISAFQVHSRISQSVRGERWLYDFRESAQIFRGDDYWFYWSS